MTFQLNGDDYKEIYDTDGNIIGCTDMDGQVEYCESCVIVNCPCKN